MTSQTIQKFLKQYPGPFDYQRSADGVDDTFEVYCETTDAYIIAYHFWDNRIPAELTADSVCFALNTLASGDTKTWTAEQLPLNNQFLQALYPGPYTTGFTECERMPSNDVVCSRSKSVVIREYRRGDGKEAQMVVETIAAALNSLRPDSNS